MLSYTKNSKSKSIAMQLGDAADAPGVHYQTAYGWVRQRVLPTRKAPRGCESQSR